MDYLLLKSLSNFVGLYFDQEEFFKSFGGSKRMRSSQLLVEDTTNELWKWKDLRRAPPNTF